MSEPTYQNFDLWIHRTADGYRARGTDAQGRSATSDFHGPFGTAELEDVRRCLRARKRWWRTRDMEAVQRFGQRLFEAVFQDELLGVWRRAPANAEGEDTGRRLRLHLTDVPELAAWPWEYLYDPERHSFLTLSQKTPVVRYLDLPRRVQPLTVRPPLRLLALLANPKDYNVLDVEGEWQRLNDALADLVQAGRLELRRLAPPTLDALQRELRGQDVHIFHFIGHGGYHERTDEGVLVLEDEDGNGRPVRAEDLAMVLHDHDALRLAVLNACESARASAQDPFAGVAQTLIQQGIPAVVAMQAEIRDTTALDLAHELYSALADGYPVDASLTEARKRISQRSLEWGLPRLYLRAPDGRIFDVEGEDEDVAVSPPLEAVEPESLGGRLWGFLSAHHGKILALAAAVPTLVYGLGLFALRAREALLGLKEQLTYSHESAVVTGLDVLWSLPWNALFALFYSEPWLLVGAWGPLAALLLLPAADRLAPRRRSSRPWIVLGVLVCTWVLLLFAVRFYMAALYPPHSDSDQTPGPAFDVGPGGAWIESIEFEAVSWLKNDDERNEERRQALAGLVGCLLLATGWSGWRVYRRRDLSRRFWVGLVIASALMVALVASLVPRAHAVAAWGLEYPQLRVVDEKCDAELFRELAEPGCCLFDVAEGGSPRVTLLWGDGCSEEVGFRTWSEDQAHCLVGRGERVISDDC